MNSNKRTNITTDSFQRAMINASKQIEGINQSGSLAVNRPSNMSNYTHRTEKGNKANYTHRSEQVDKNTIKSRSSVRTTSVRR